MPVSSTSSSTTLQQQLLIQLREMRAAKTSQATATASPSSETDGVPAAATTKPRGTEGAVRPSPQLMTMFLGLQDAGSQPATATGSSAASGVQAAAGGGFAKLVSDLESLLGGGGAAAAAPAASAEAGGRTASAGSRPPHHKAPAAGVSSDTGMSDSSLQGGSGVMFQALRQYAARQTGAAGTGTSLSA